MPLVTIEVSLFLGFEDQFGKNTIKRKSGGIFGK